MQRSASVWEATGCHSPHRGTPGESSSRAPQSRVPSFFTHMLSQGAPEWLRVPSAQQLCLVQTGWRSDETICLIITVRLRLFLIPAQRAGSLYSGVLSVCFRHSNEHADSPSPIGLALPSPQPWPFQAVVAFYPHHSLRLPSIFAFHSHLDCTLWEMKHLKPTYTIPSASLRARVSLLYLNNKQNSFC